MTQQIFLVFLGEKNAFLRHPYDTKIVSIGRAVGPQSNYVTDEFGKAQRTNCKRSNKHKSEEVIVEKYLVEY